MNKIRSDAYSVRNNLGNNAITKSRHYIIMTTLKWCWMKQQKTKFPRTKSSSGFFLGLFGNLRRQKILLNWKVGKNGQILIKMHETLFYDFCLVFHCKLCENAHFCWWFLMLPDGIYRVELKRRFPSKIVSLRFITTIVADLLSALG